jgi:hypothetical protein
MPIYGVTVPSTDPMVFSMVDLPADRSGLLTLSPFLTSKSRPDGTSVVGRGLAVNASVLCQANPELPNPVPQEILDGQAATANMSQKEAADYRASPDHALCAGCHAAFDAFGLVLEPFDSVGRSRTADLQNRPIDATWTTVTLPDTVGGVTANGAVEVAQAIITSGALNSCMAMNFINFALADESQGSARAQMPQPPTNTCAVKAVTDAFETTDKSFTSLIREIAASNTLALRSRGM